VAPSLGRDSASRECASSGNAKPMSSANVSLPATGPESPATPTCVSSTRQMSPQSMSSAADSPAKTSASPEKEPGLTGHARVFGQSTRVSLANYDPGTSSWRTSQLSLLEDSTAFSPTWPRSGMTRSGTAFPLLPLVPLTDVTGSGLLHTPTAAANQAAPSMRSRDAGSWFREEREMWPTPNAAKAANDTGLQASGDGRTKPNKLGWAVAEAERAWPTPTARLGQARGAQPKRYLDPARSNDLDDAVALAETFKTPTSAPFSHGGSGGELHKQVAPSGGPLNPQWVAWLMGFPIDWTSLPPSATRSSRKSRSGSANESLTTKKGG
jgi:hypothetical protein